MECSNVRGIRGSSYGLVERSNNAERTEWLSRGTASPAGAYHDFLLAEK